ncbi:demethoxyubiquinone hydroxylase family protein [Candidatus Desulfosporosinus nitrosoreducens]|uniref:demethoxyubiquinone hydroxylase family protein n=1 Tax=Candidatus Desulfosporosinus nitrosoreducens TaxID=3401928 RepID=UPI00280B2155|nr:demethoxyubiquinone hydroxylase family protein [Desulfosporosinus sp. PR]
MDNKLIARFKEFYTLETFQVAFYKAQANSATDEYYRRAFEKLVQIEQGHADYFANEIGNANEEVPSLTGSFFQLAGNLLGESVEPLGRHNTCKLGAALENEAIKKYRMFIKECKTKNYLIFKYTLMDYLLDEEFHTLWLKDYMNSHPG